MIAHGAVHTYEMAIPLFMVTWLAEFEVIDFGLMQVEVTTASLGIVVTLGYGLFGVGALPGGVLVDRIGSRRLISACLLGMGTSYLLLGLAPSMLVVAFALVVWGATASVYHPAGLSLISKGIENRGTGFAYHGMAGNLGIGLGPLLTAILLLFVDWRTVAQILGAPALLAAVYAARANFDETAAVNRTVANGGSKAESDIGSFGEFLAESKRMFTGSFLLVFVIVMFSGLYYRGILTFLPELLQRLPGFDPIPVGALVSDSLLSSLGVGISTDRVISPQDYFYSGLLLVGVVGQYIGGKLTDRFPVEYGAAGGYGVLAVLAILFVPVAESGILPLLAFGAILGVSLFFVQPIYQDMVAEYTPPGTRGLSYGFTYLGVFGVGALGGGIAGTIIAYANEETLFLTLAGFAAVGSILGLFLGREDDR